MTCFSSQFAQRCYLLYVPLDGKTPLRLEPIAEPQFEP